MTGSFGNVSLSKTLNIGIFDSVGIATTTPGDKVLKVGSGGTEFSVDTSGRAGVGTAANVFQFRVEGDSYFSGNINSAGVVTATQFSGVVLDSITCLQTVCLVLFPWVLELVSSPITWFA